jgi:phage terminase small subunit
MQQINSTKPPRNLSKEARVWWQTIQSEWNLDSTGILYLNTAMESFDTMRKSQAILDKEGLVIVDRFKVQRQHPATLILRDARNQMLKALAALNLDISGLNK